MPLTSFFCWHSNMSHKHHKWSFRSINSVDYISKMSIYLVRLIQEKQLTKTQRHYKTFQKFCSDVAQFGICFFLDQTHQINGHFGYILTELIEQKDQLLCLWDILECQQKKLVEGKACFIFYFCFCVAPAGLKYATLFVYCCAIIRY